MNIKDLRELTRLSQKDFGKRIGVKYQTILLYEKGKNVPETVQKLIRYEFAEFLPEEERLVSGPGENNGGATVDTTGIEALKKENEALKEKLKNAQRVANLLERNTELLEDQVKIYKDRLNIIDDKSKTA
jgi:DNA-binding XRE family transcriptional regulator